MGYWQEGSTSTANISKNREHCWNGGSGKYPQLFNQRIGVPFIFGTLHIYSSFSISKMVLKMPSATMLNSL